MRRRIVTADLDNNKIRKLLNYRESCNNIGKRGKPLEELACYIFKNIPGIEILAKNQHDKYHSYEIDLVLWNDQDRKGVYFLPSRVIIECKNWKAPVNVKELSWFIQKVKSNGLSLGILVAQTGISGSESGGAYAYHVLEKALSEGCQIIVLTAKDLENITNTGQIVEILKEKYRAPLIPVKNS